MLAIANVILMGSFVEHSANAHNVKINSQDKICKILDKIRDVNVLNQDVRRTTVNAIRKGKCVIKNVAV